MKKILSVFVSSLVSVGINAQVVKVSDTQTSTTANASEVVTDSIHSEKLNAWVKYNVYLPDRYKESNAHYPVVYLLHGLTGHYDSWRDGGRMQEAADNVMRSGECRPCVIIMPTAGGVDTYRVQNGYFNVEGWPYEDFFFQEFIPAVEDKYRAGGSREERAVMGYSMGGGGSVAYSQRHRGMFSSCYAMCPWLDNKNNEVNPNPSTPNSKLSTPNSEPTLRQRTCESVKKNSCIDFIRNADAKTVSELTRTKWFVDCGDDDFLLQQSMDFYSAMREKKVPCEMTMRNGIHDWQYWHVALTKALPFASRCFYDGRPQTHEAFADFARYAEANKALLAQDNECGEPQSQTQGNVYMVNGKRYMENGVEPRVVLMGNSITDFWITVCPETFKRRPWLIDRGISGQTTYQFLMRFREDVVNLHPAVVVINGGTNDIAMNTGVYNEDWTVGNIQSMIDIAQANNIKVVLGSVLPSGYFFWRPEVTDQMQKIIHLNGRLKAVAKERGIPYVDYFTALRSKDGKVLAPRYSEDGTHPNREGYAKMEKLLFPVIAKLRAEKK